MHIGLGKSVSLEVRPELLRLLEGFSCFFNSDMAVGTVALKKPSNSAVFATEASAIRAPTICHFSNSVGSRILTYIFSKSRKKITDILSNR